MYGLPFCMLWNCSPILKMKIGNAREMGFCIMTCTMTTRPWTFQIQSSWPGSVVSGRSVCVMLLEVGIFGITVCLVWRQNVSTDGSDLNGRFNAFELWCWRRLLRVLWTARRSNQSILKEISPGCSPETDVEGETLILWPLDAKSWLIWKDPDGGKDWGQEEKGTTRWDGWMASLT